MPIGVGSRTDLAWFDDMDIALALRTMGIPGRGGAKEWTVHLPAGAGVVHVKIRGRIADANVMERSLRGDGAESVWVFGYREGDRSVAVLARALALAGAAGEDGAHSP